MNADGRGWRWGLATGLAGFVGVAPVAQEAGEPAPMVHDYVRELEELVAHGQGEGENAWPYIVGAAVPVEAIVTELESGLEWDEFIDANWYNSEPYLTAEDIARSRACYERVSEFFDILNKATHAPFAAVELGDVEEWLQKGYTNRLQLGAILKLGRFRCASIYLAGEPGRAEDAGVAVADVLALTKHLSHQPNSLGWVIAQALRRTALREIRLGLLEQRFAQSEVHQMLRALDDHQLAPFAKAVRMDSVFQRAFIDVLFDEGRKDRDERLRALIDEVEFVDRLLKPVEEQRLNVEDLPTREEMLKAHDRTYSVLLRQAALPRDERTLGSADYQRMQSEMGRRFTLTWLVIKTFPTFLRKPDVIALEEAGSRLMFKLELYRGVHGTYPRTLNAVAEAGELDGNDPLFGGRFGYRALDAPDEFGRGYLLYSVGLDGEDNGGRVMEFREDIAVTDEAAGRGYDYIINEPRHWPWRVEQAKAARERKNREGDS